MQNSRRVFLQRSGMAAAAGSFASLALSGCDERLRPTFDARPTPHPHTGFRGFGALALDPAGILNLPTGFSYRILSQEGDPLSDPLTQGLVPSSHDGMGAFQGPGQGMLVVRNHELNVDDITQEGKIAVKHLPGLIYDHDAVGGTTTLHINEDRQLLSHKVSLAGTLNNCAGGVTPWGTWLTCEESTDELSKPHGYVFEVCPNQGGNPEPIVAMGRFYHEAVAFGTRGEAYLSEDASNPYGCMYRYLPLKPHGGRGSLHAGGTLQAMQIIGVDSGKDLSSVHTPGIVLPVRWVDITHVNPRPYHTPVREQARILGATQIPKCEGLWTDGQGNIWMTSSRADGPNADSDGPKSGSVHGGQIWRYDPTTSSIELILEIGKDEAWDGPDNISVSPHGYALICSDGESDQWIAALDTQGDLHPFAFNAANEEEFAGATFSPDGKTLLVNVQGDCEHGVGPKGRTFAIWGPFEGLGS